MNYIREYNDKIQSGEIITSRRVKSVYARLVKEMDDENSPFYFDENSCLKIFLCLVIGANLAA